MSAVSRAGGDDNMASGQDAKRRDAKQLDSASMNEAMQQHIMAHMTEAELKIEEHETATGRTCPALMSVPRATTRVSAVKLVAVTGNRFLNAFPDAPPTAPPPTPPMQRSGSLDEGSSYKCACEEESVASGDDGEAAATDALVAIINGRAPECLSTNEVLNLVAVAQLFLAEVVLAALPAYVRPLLDSLSAQEVATLLFRLTQALHQESTHAPLLQIYRDAWPRLAEVPAACEQPAEANIQRILTGAADSCVPPAEHGAFFTQAARQVGQPPGMRLTCFIGACLAACAEALDAKEGLADTNEVLAPLHQLDPRSPTGVRDILAMPRHLHNALFAFLRRAWRQASGSTNRNLVVQHITETVLQACIPLLPHAPPVLQPSQLSVGHAIAQDAGHRRAVVAARLPLDVAHSSTVASSFACGVEVSLRVSGPAPPADTPHLGAFVRLWGACVHRPRRVIACLGLAARSEAAMAALADAAQWWCSSGKEPPRLKPRPGLWTTRLCGSLVLQNRGQGYENAFPAAEWAALGYALTDREEVVAFACCEWPAAGAPAPAAEAPV